MEPYLLLLVLILGAFVLWQRGAGSRASKKRNAHAQRGERLAAELLDHEGFRILDEQVVGYWELFVDEEPITVQVRADYLVERHGLTFVAEVKTGALAPDPLYPPTRRQLLEYTLAFDVEGVLLIDIDEEVILEVAFPVAPLDHVVTLPR